MCAYVRLNGGLLSDCLSFAPSILVVYLPSEQSAGFGIRSGHVRRAAAVQEAAATE